MRDIGKNIRQLRVDKGLTQEELAERLFVTRQTVSNYESGRSRPDVEMLEQIAQALETNVSALLYGPHIPTPEERRRRTRYWFELGGAVLLVVFMWFAVRWASAYAQNTFLTSPKLFAKWLFFPLALGVLGFVMLDGIMLFLCPTTLRRSLALSIRWVSLAALCGFVFLALLQIVPLAIWHEGFNFGALFNNALWFTLEFIGNQPWLMLFPGAALRLGFHTQKAEKRA